MTKPPEIGTDRWAQEVFSTPPVRDPRGRSRPTQRYLVLAHDRPEVLVGEGGNEANARTLLTAAVIAGAVRRFKFQPFRLHPAEFGLDATPDILFESSEKKRYVVEVKSKKYLTTKVIEKCKRVEEVVNKHSMTYLLWTDSWPLGPATWRLLRKLRRCGTGRVPESAMRAISEAVEAKPLTLKQLQEHGHNHEVLLAAVWHGLVHINLFEEFNHATLVSSDIRTRKFDTTLSARVDAQVWWDQIPRN